MCLTTKSLGSPCLQSCYDSPYHAVIQSGRRSPEKLTMSSLLSRSREFALMILVVAFLGHHAKRTTTTNEDYSLELLEQVRTATELSSDQYASTFTALLAFFIGSAFTASILIGEPSMERLERWFGAFFSSTKSAVSNVSSSAAMTRICSTVNASSMRLFHLAPRCHHHNSGSNQQGRTLAISGPREPFLALDDIAILSLSDVKDLFRHAASVNGLQHSSLLMVGGEPSSSPALQRATNAVDRVIALSRGIHVSVSSFLEGFDRPRTGHVSFVDMDALAFVAICRLFAEWRGFRLVPEGKNPGYAMGMNLARRDLLQNVAKMEKAVHSFLAHYQQQNDEKPTELRTSPTLRQLLEFEINQDVHRHLPRLNDKSGASGFLWTIRQLRYQTNILANCTQVPLVFPNTKAAANAAYHAVYDPYHGFFTRKIFTASFDAAPKADEILSQMMMNLPASDDSSDEAMTQPSSVDEDDTWVQLPLDDAPSSEHIIENKDDYNKNNNSNNNDIFEHEEWHEAREEHEHPLEQLGGHLAREWLKMHRFMAQCTGRDAQRHSSRNVMDISTASLCGGGKYQQHRAAHAQVQSFVAFMQPFLDDMDAMMKELNLNDPTRV